MAPPPVGELEKAVGQLLLTYRLDCEFSQAQVAADITRLLGTTGFSVAAWTQATVSKIEAGHRGLSLVEADCLASYMGRGLGALLRDARDSMVDA